MQEVGLVGELHGQHGDLEEAGRFDYIPEEVEEDSLGEDNLGEDSLGLGNLAVQERIGEGRTVGRKVGDNFLVVGNLQAAGNQDSLQEVDSET